MKSMSRSDAVPCPHSAFHIQHSAFSITNTIILWQITTKSPTFGKRKTGWPYGLASWSLPSVALPSLPKASTFPPPSSAPGIGGKTWTKRNHWPPNSLASSGSSCSAPSWCLVSCSVSASSCKARKSASSSLPSSCCLSSASWCAL